jgi:lysozyme
VIYSKSGLALTESFEGCRLQSYQDSKGVWTIGYGHTRGVSEGMVISRAQAQASLRVDIDAAQSAVNRLVRVSLSQAEFDALVDFEFNTGHLLGSTLLAKLNGADIAGAANEFERWDHCGGQVVAGLLRRRLAEAEEFKR